MGCTRLLLFWVLLNPDIDELLYSRPFSTTGTALTGISLREFRQRHDVEAAVFPVCGANHLHAAFTEQSSDFKLTATGIDMLLNIYFDR